MVAITFLYIFLALSGVYSIIVSLVQLTQPVNRVPDSTIQTKYFKYKAPAGLVYGIVSICLVVFLVNNDSRIIYENQITQIRNENDRLRKENDFLHSSLPKESDSRFQVLLNGSQPTSLFGGKVIATWQFNIITSSKITFVGILGASKNISGPFSLSIVECDYGDKFFLKVDSISMWGVNVLDERPNAKLEFYRP